MRWINIPRPRTSPPRDSLSPTSILTCKICITIPPIFEIPGWEILWFFSPSNSGRMPSRYFLSFGILTFSSPASSHTLVV